MNDSTSEAWTPSLLKDHFEARLEDHRTYADRRVDEVEKAFTTHLEEATAALNAAMTASSRATDAALVASTKAIEAALIASNKAIEAAFAASDKAIDKAEAATKDRFESVNEFRAQLRDQSATMLTRELFEQAMRDVRNRQDGMQSRIEEIAGQQRELFARTEGGRDTSASVRANIASVVAVVAVIAAVVAIFIR